MTKPLFPKFISVVKNKEFENMIFVCRDWCSSVCPSLDEDEHFCDRWKRKLRKLEMDIHKRCKECKETEMAAKLYKISQKNKKEAVKR